MPASCEGVAQFDYTIWAARYPELSGSVNQAQAQGFFDEAGLYLNNTPFSRVRNLVIRAVILGMLTAHLAQLFASINGQVSPQTVGRISNASEGSVSVALDMGPQPANAAWFMQTKYGAAAYQALKPYWQGGRYRPGPQPYLGVGPVGVGRIIR